MERFRLYNLIFGWGSFLVAATVYLATMEPTVSFWDCGEFIAASYKLQVGHPPGAPFFLLLGRLFAIFAGDPSRVAAMINSISALASAFTIMFLFWTVTHLVKRLIKAEGKNTPGQLIIIIGAGLVAALAFTFSDSFWFSAVEGEVYATSSLFTAVVFWAILKWENIADQPHADRWLVLIAYLMGLSIGVHLLNLLAIPAIVFVYYHRKYQPTRRGYITAAMITLLILGFIQFLLIPGVVAVAKWFELAFVNGIGLPYYSGALVYILLLVGFLIFGLYFTHKKKRVILNTILLCFTVMLVGYSSYTVILIRSSANPPMDQNNPETLFSLLRYINREQYQATPVLKGPYYNAPVIDIKQGEKTYTPKDGKYEVTNRDPEYTYDPRFVTLFPRMHSRVEQQHVDDYQVWGKIKGERITVQGAQNNVIIKPTFGENLRFFFRYQLGHMYFRYFMWNFSGRQNDIQGHGSVLEGNWISGIPFIDDARLGPQENLPEVYKNNKARNRYFMLPLLLGLVGLIFQYKRDGRNFLVIFLLFFFTGIAIVLYLNQWPHQPRERDYAYAASFYAFSIWIGMGVLALYRLLKRYLPEVIVAIGVSTICLVFVPGLMAGQNWDDHDRSGRYTARDFAANYLNSCDTNAILFTNGDNDTFPLWYAQDVEGIRTDVRVVNLSYLGASWYITQMKAKAYESDPVPLSLTEDKYLQGTRDIILFNVRIDSYEDIGNILDFIASDDPRSRVQSPFMRGEEVDFIPTRKLRIPVDTLKVIENGTVSERFRDEIQSELNWEINREYLYKNDLMILDLMATNDWDRPVYFAITVPSDAYLELENFFMVEGFAYRVVPLETERMPQGFGRVESEQMFNNMMNLFAWGGIEDSSLYLDENNRRMLSNYRNSFGRLASQLIDEGKMDSARVVLDKCLELIPHKMVPHNYFSTLLIEDLYRIGDFERGDQLARQLADVYESELMFVFSLDQKYSWRVVDQKQLGMYIMRELARITTTFGGEEIKNEMTGRFQRLAGLYNAGA